MNETLHTIFNRASLRKFSEKQVTQEEIDLIIKSAIRAPSAGNLMNYSIIRIENKETLEKLSHTCDEQPFIKTASFALIFVVDYQKLYDYFEESNILSYCSKRGLEAGYPELSDLLLGSQDAIAAAQNAVIGAESLGVGSCYIGDIFENYEIHRDLLHLEDLTFPLGMLVFGHYDENHKPKTQSRFDEKYVVFKETYRKLDREELLDMYSERQNRFVPNNKLGANNAGQLIYGMKFGSEFALEMRRSVEVAFKAWMNQTNKKN